MRNKRKSYKERIEKRPYGFDVLKVHSVTSCYECPFTKMIQDPEEDIWPEFFCTQKQLNVGAYRSAYKFHEECPLLTVEPEVNE